jgi:hypothetical protein
MCFTGKCKYENYDGECTIPLHAPYPEDALCATDLDLFGGYDDHVFQDLDLDSEDSDGL